MSRCGLALPVPNCENEKDLDLSIYVCVRPALQVLYQASRRILVSSSSQG